MSKTLSNNKAFSLVEIIVAISVFSIALTALVVAFNPAVVGAVNPAIQIRAAELGQAYMEEIIGKRYDENTNIGASRRCGEVGVSACSTALGPDSGESRNRFDDVDDFNGLVEAPRNPLGETRAGYDSYTISVQVAYAGTDLGLNNNDAKRIELTIQGQAGQQFQFSTYKTNF